MCARLHPTTGVVQIGAPAQWCDRAEREGVEVVYLEGPMIEDHQVMLGASPDQLVGERTGDRKPRHEAPHVEATTGHNAEPGAVHAVLLSGALGVPARLGRLLRDPLDDIRYWP